MLFTGQISVDPSEITKIRKVEPTSFFKRLLHTISNGKIKDLIEEENFTAVSILQQLSKVMMSMGIKNIIRLSHNDHDYYLDRHGDEDDLERALENYSSEVKTDKSISFTHLSMVLEHNEDTFHYYLEIKVNRSHKVGDYPIEIKVNALINEFFEHLIDKHRLKNKMEHVFRSQDAYDFYCTSKLKEFSHFLEMMGEEIKQFIPIDDLIIEYSPVIILPTDGISHPEEIVLKDYSKGPAFHGYYQSNERLWYAYLWPELCSDHDTYVHNTLIYSGSGNQIGELGDQGIEAGDSPLFDLESDEGIFDDFDSEEGGEESEDKPDSWF